MLVKITSILLVILAVGMFIGFVTGVVSHMLFWVSAAVLAFLAYVVIPHLSKKEKLYKRKMNRR